MSYGSSKPQTLLLQPARKYFSLTRLSISSLAVGFG
jgi:hypothetical protein